ncbi:MULTISPECIES: leucine-rich repeat domain-containing protein [Cyanophyceae]|uniref:leucine-rich repeat domain-containing protein n=1 Tax=Cyanophyceae TaxID=3028117 RepID=UPI0016849DDB|nr:leucine-rich repeat domain-containing protein [Trichocoleus sp. FACHB-40]MBD2007067.1 leucine-rich repeat domain-containing protein [Trichocoleus sp. FACHB-40]
MKIKKHPQLNIYQTIPRALLPFKPLGTLALLLLVSCSSTETVCLPQATTSTKTVPRPQTATSRTFADWCLNKNKQSVETRRTVDVLLQVAKTQDCKQADKFLSTRITLDLDEKQITDIKPLSSLTNLTQLQLNNKQ